MNSKPVVNAAHGEGPTYIAFSPDGAFTYTGGCDAIVRVWRTDLGADQDPPTAIDSLESITSLAAASDCWLSGSEDSEVRRYLKGGTDLDGLVTSAAGVAIRCVAVDPKGKRLAVASDELAVKVVDLADTTKVCLLQGHTKGVRKVTWHPSGSYVTTSGADGVVIVWDVSEEEPKQVETVRGVLPAVHDTESADFSHDCSAIWHPSGEYFLVASRAHDIVAISRSTWSKSFTLSDDTQAGAVTALALSPNGVYLASASKAGVFIWSIQSRRVLFRLPVPSPNASVTQLAWSPKQNLLAWTDTDGNIIRHNDVIPASSPDPVKQPASVSAKRLDTPTLFDDVADVDIGRKGASAGEGDVDLDADLMGDFLDDDLGDYLKDDDEAERKFTGGRIEVVNITKAQPPFQPGSSPMDATKRKRLLAYNMLGYIEVTDQDTHHVVDVKMHDQSSTSPRKGYVFTDSFKYDLASLGERGIVFACQPENDHRAHVAYKPYASWETGARASEDEWSYDLPTGVKVLGIAAGGAPLPKSARRRALSEDTHGRGHVVVATSENEITFLTGTGIERYSMGLDGDFVSMVAGPEWVFIVHRDGATTIDGSQNLKGTLITLDDFCVLQERRLPIPKNHTLKWIGVTEEGAPAIYDSTGTVQIMPRFRIPLRATWARVLDTNALERREGKDESYWPFAVTGNTFRCLILKGRQEHPPFPVPYAQELPMRLPFRKTDQDEASLEEKFARQSMFLDISRDALGEELTTDDIAKQEAALDTELLKLIQKACSTTSDRPSRQTRALELTRLLHHVAFVDKAIQVAHFYKLRGLEDRMGRIKAEREDEDRLRAARERRRAWASDLDAVPPPPAPRTTQNEARAKAFQDFNPPAPMHRPGLARATPAPAEPFRAAAPKRGAGVSSAQHSLPVSLDDDGLSISSSPFQEGKRKRLEGDNDVDAIPDANTKRRALDNVVTPPKPKSNPFARKTATDNTRNPFARQAENNKSLHKSESFFNAVEAAETDKSKPPAPAKSKGKAKEVSRQTTLFGLPARTPADEPKKGRKKKGVAEDLDTTQDSTSVLVDSQLTVATEVDTTDADTQMSAGDTQVVESETQLTEDDVMEETQPSETEAPLDVVVPSAEEPREVSPDPMEWPASPVPTTVPLAA